MQSYPQELPDSRTIAGGLTSPSVAAEMMLRRGRPNLSASCWASSSTTPKTRDWSCSRSCRSAILQEARRPHHPLAAAAAQARHDSLPPVGQLAMLQNADRGALECTAAQGRTCCLGLPPPPEASATLNWSAGAAKG